MPIELRKACVGLSDKSTATEIKFRHQIPGAYENNDETQLGLLCPRSMAGWHKQVLRSVRLSVCPVFCFDSVPFARYARVAVSNAFDQRQQEAMFASKLY